MRPRASSERLDKLSTLENQTSLEWVLKCSVLTDMKSNIKMIPKETLDLKIQAPEHEGVATIWSEVNFGLKKISQFRGLLIYDNQFCLILNDCFIEKKRYQQSHFRAYFIKLTNLTGQLVLIFTHPASQKQWSQCIKKYCKRKEFYKKYRISEKICQNFYAVQHKKSKQMYCTQVITLNTLINYYQADILDNYLKILRNSTINNYLSIIGVFEEKQILFIVSKYFKGNSLDQYITTSQNELVNQSGLATIAINILIALKALQDEELYHGCISFENIICYQSQKNKFGVYLINSNYKSFEENDHQQYCNSIPQFLLAPEIIKGQMPSISSDLYQLGIVLGLITFYQFKEPFNHEYAEKRSGLLNLLIESQEKIMMNQQKTEYPMLQSLSQLELIKKLIAPNIQNRITVQDAVKHTWLINTNKKKVNKLLTKNTSLLPSLRTIIEIKEQSECEIKRTLQNVNDATSQKFHPDPISMMSKQMNQNTGSFTEFNDDEDDALYFLIEQLNQKQYQLLPSMKNHTLKYQQD